MPTPKSHPVSPRKAGGKKVEKERTGDVDMGEALPPLASFPDDDEDDPVVSVLPVNLCHFSDPDGFYAKFYGIKYPTRPVYRPFGEKEELARVEFGVESGRPKFEYTSTSKDGSERLLHHNCESKYTALRSMQLIGANTENDSQGYVGAVKDGIFKVWFILDFIRFEFSLIIGNHLFAVVND